MSGLVVDLQQEGPIPLAASFACAPGEVLALVGPSGSGKSTILRAIAGTYRARTGRIAVNGHTWFDDATCLAAHRRSVGMVFQSYALFPHMSAIDNVAAGITVGERVTRRRRAAELLELVHLSGLEGRYPRELSGGQQQRVAVARALAREPQVLLLDEPFSAVDKATRQRLYREIAELRRGLRMPVLLVTHDLDEAVMLADRMSALHRGATLQTGTPQEVTTRPVSAQVARLVDLRNVFEGRVLERNADGKGARLAWAGLVLEVADAGTAAVGAHLSWVIPDGFVVPHRRDRPSRGERENPVPGVIESVLFIGPSAHLTLRPQGDETHPLHFSVPSHVVRRNGFEPGVAATVSLLAEGIHLLA